MWQVRCQKKICQNTITVEDVYTGAEGPSALESREISADKRGEATRIDSECLQFEKLTVLASNRLEVSSKGLKKKKKNTSQLRVWWDITFKKKKKSKCINTKSGTFSS